MMNMKSDKNPLISVVIPAYNSQKYVCAAIDSVLSQTYTPVEVIVVDDGSKDKTKEKVLSYQHRIRYIYQPNAGPSAARNRGIKEAKGELIAFLDTDDSWLPKKLETQLALMRREPLIGVVSCGWYQIDEDSHVLRVVRGKQYKNDSEFLRDLSRQKALGASCSGVLVRRECFQAAGLFDEALTAAEDWDMWLRFAEHYSIKNIEEPLVEVRLRKKSLSSSTFVENILKSELSVFQRHWTNNSVFCKNFFLRCSAKSGFYRSAALSYREAGQRGKTLTHILKALFYYPLNVFSKKSLAALIYAILGYQRRPDQKGPSKTTETSLPLVSVVIPTYNHHRYVCDAVESVLNQTYPSLDVIVVDDGSTDETKQVLQKYAKKVRYVFQKNQGLSAARNKGISLAKGELVAFLDSDDLWLPQKLAAQVPVMLSSEDIGLISCGWYQIDDKQNVLAKIEGNVFQNRQELLNALSRRNVISGSGSGALMRKACFDEVGLFDENLTAAEDWDMWLRVVPRYEMRTVPEPLIKIRLLPESMCSPVHVENMLKNELKVLNKQVKTNPRFRKNFLSRARAFSARYQAAAVAYRETGKRLKAFQYTLKAIGFFPFQVFQKTSLALLAYGIFGGSQKQCTRIFFNIS